MDESKANVYYDWHGKIKFLEGTVQIENFISLYEHHLEIEHYSIIGCQSTWLNLYFLLINKDSAAQKLVQIPWTSHFTNASRHDTVDDVPRFRCFDIPAIDAEPHISWLKFSRMSENYQIDRETRFCHFGLKWSKTEEKARRRHSNTVSPLPAMFACTENSLHIVSSNTSPVCHVIEYEEQNEKCSFKTKRRTLAFARHDSGVRLKNIAGGNRHVVFLDTDGFVYTVGTGTRGELGHGDTESIVDGNPKLVEGLVGLKIRQIAAGGWHNAALTEFGDVYVWGWNNACQCGMNRQVVTVVSQPTFLDLKVEEKEVNIRQISCGTQSTFLLTETGDVYASGPVSCEEQKHNIIDTHLRKISNTSCDNKVCDIRAFRWTCILQYDQ